MNPSDDFYGFLRQRKKTAKMQRRELAIIRMRGEGLTLRQIAEELNIKPSLVSHAITNLIRQGRVEARTQTHWSRKEARAELADAMDQSLRRHVHNNDVPGARPDSAIEALPEHHGAVDDHRDGDDLADECSSPAARPPRDVAA